MRDHRRDGEGGKLNSEFGIRNFGSASGNGLRSPEVPGIPT